MQTRTGQQFWPLDPRPEEIHLEDIAHALSMLCRYGGHVRAFYSVAEHSVLVSENAAPELALAGLLHDASEAYLADIIRPVKRNLPGYAEIENRLMRAVCQRFGISEELLLAIKPIDDRIIEDERRALMGEPAGTWGDREPLGVTLLCLPPGQAKFLFLSRFEELTGVVS